MLSFSLPPFFFLFLFLFFFSFFFFFFFFLEEKAGWLSVSKLVVTLEGGVGHRPTLRPRWPSCHPRQIWELFYFFLKKIILFKKKKN
jgi:hypothetical protein